MLFLLFGLICAGIFRFIKTEYQKYYLLSANVLFYLICDWRMFGIMLIQIVLSYVCSYVFTSDKRMSSDDSVNRPIYIVAAVIASISILIIFKFAPFLGGTFARIYMPLGISYYTFRIISYLIEVSKKEREPSPFVDYMVYVSFFAQIICGPISRPKYMLHDNGHLKLGQIVSISDDLHKPIYLILSGLFKKLVIANRLNGYNTTVMSSFASGSGLALLMSMFFWSIELYCDFAGISEVAAGITLLFGFDCPDNFRLPYFSSNIVEFWKRWHITLSGWLKDYIYIPLGGNRKGKFRQKVNIIIIFLVSGVWHGNGIVYILWGLWHGLLNLITPRTEKSKSSSHLIGAVMSRLLTFIAVTVGWLAFKLNSPADIGRYLLRMVSTFSLSLNSIIAAVMPFTGDYSCVAAFITVLLCIFMLFIIELRDYTGKKSHTGIRIVLYTVAIIMLGVFGESSFIYANY